MNRISRCNPGAEGVWFEDHNISSLLFADDVVVLLAHSSQDLQHVLEQCAAKCDAGMGISTSKYQSWFSTRKRWLALCRLEESPYLKCKSLIILGSCS